MELYNPKSLSNALDILAGGNCTVLAGGTDLLVKNRFRNKIINICDLKELDFIEDTGGGLEIGAGVTHGQIEKSTIIKKYAPVLAAGCSMVGSTQIRNKGTLGGNIVSASPAGDTLTSLSVLNCQLVLNSKSRERHISLLEFITGPGKHILDDNELVTRIIIEKMDEKECWYYKKVGLRNALSIAVVGAAIRGLVQDGVFKRLDIALGSVGPKIQLPKELANMFLDKSFEKKEVWMILDNVDRYITPIDDIRASREQRVLTIKGVLFEGLCRLLSI
ncbi:FAD binding domain-containing protein [Desulfitibacter alkalitolerans]|uniref:FAD binding domain-containing protein n=1 Tax=Desulfitibacter alkalitolerans TaxID=264641 RepID=UPI00146FA708|nr:FAD binding domain-containing protein [Desulfitibacter alkalitolerans]